MARTSAKAKKPKQDVNKSTTENSKQMKVIKDEHEVKRSNDSEDTNDSTDKENDDANYEVEKVVHTRVLRGKRQYLVRWKGYNEDSDTWENESVLHSCGEALEIFKRENPNLDEKLKADSDGEAEDERSGDSEDEKNKGRKKTKKETKKIIIKKNKNIGASSTKEISDSEVQASTESDEEIQEKVNNEKEKSNKKESKAIKNIQKESEKSLKDETDEPEKKRKKKSEVTDDVNVTDGTNYEVEKIVEVHTRKDGSREFLIRWKGYKPSEDTWEPEAHLDCQDLIDKFMEKVNKAKSIPARELRESRTPTNRFIPFSKSRGSRNNLRNIGFRPVYQE